MKTLITSAFFVLVYLTCPSYGEETQALLHESEAGVIVATGNSDTQTYSVKQTTSYKWAANLAKFTGSYLLGKSAGIENARAWDLGLRYEREISERVSAFAAYQVDSNVFTGVDLRHSVDLGGKYFFLKTDSVTVSNETGYRFLSENLLQPSRTVNSHLGRLQFEWLQKWNDFVSHKFYVEYLPNFSTWQDYRINVEPSLSIMLSKVFSLKLAYLMQYRNVPAAFGKKRFDSLYTTSLVAKF